MGMGSLPGSGAEEEDGDGGVFAEINITPLTDVFLVMLIIFFVAAIVSVEQEKEKAEQQIEQVKSGLRVSLPSGQAKDVDLAQESVIVTMDVSGKIDVNGVAADTPEMQRLFQNAFIKKNDSQVIIRADKGVPHGRVIAVVEIARRAGLSQFAFATEQ